MNIKSLKLRNKMQQKLNQDSITGGMYTGDIIDALKELIELVVMIYDHVDNMGTKK